MAVANTKSTTITNLENGDKNDNRGDGGRLRVKSDTALVAIADDAASVYRLFQIQSGDRVVSVTFITDALGAGADDVDIGLYLPNDGAVVDQDILVSTADLTLIQDGSTEFITTGTGYTEAAINEAIWERLGLSADPFVTYDLCATIVSNPAAAGNLGVVVKYTDGT